MSNETCHTITIERTIVDKFQNELSAAAGTALAGGAESISGTLYELYASLDQFFAAHGANGTGLVTVDADKLAAYQQDWYANSGMLLSAGLTGEAHASEEWRVKFAEMVKQEGVGG